MRTGIDGDQVRLFRAVNTTMTIPVSAPRRMEEDPQSDVQDPFAVDDK